MIVSIHILQSLIVGSAAMLNTAVGRSPHRQVRHYERVLYEKLYIWEIIFTFYRNLIQ